MRNLFLAVLFVGLAVGPAFAAPSRRAQEEDEIPKKENWQSLNMEATAVMGEIKYQHGDLSGAADTFRDSLNSSTQLLRPQEQVVALDLYRSAELSARRKDFAAAREHLDILIGRFPDSEWAERGRRLRELLPHGKQSPLPEGDEAATPLVSAEQPEFTLAKIQADLRDDRPEEALEGCRRFAESFPAHPSSEEVRLLTGALYLRLGEPARAVRVLKALSPKPGALKSRAIFLLAAAQLELGDYEGVRRTLAASGRAADRWLVLAQAWQAAGDDRLGRFPAALGRFESVVNSRIQSPVRAYALAALGADLDRAGRTKEAASALSRAAGEAARWGIADLESTSRLSQAHMLYKLKRLEEAVAAYAAFMRREPEHPQRTLALYQEGLALKRLGRAQRAVSAFSEITQKHPDSVYAADAHLQLGQLYARLGLSEQASQHYRDMGKAGGKAAEKESLLLIAQVHYNAKRFRRAIPLYWRFLEQNPGDPRAKEVQELLLTAYWLGARSDGGLLKAVALYPNHAIVSHILWELAAQAYRKRDYRRSAELFARASSEFPDSPRAADSLFYEGESFSKLDDADAAAAAYRRLISRFPKSRFARQASQRLEASAAEDLFAKAVSLSKEKKTKAALASYEQLLTRFPRYPKSSWAWFEIGELRQALGRLGPAAAAYAQVSSSDARKTAALFNLGRIRERLKQTSLAVRTYEQLRKTRPAEDPLRVRGLLRLGFLLELKNQPRKALPLYAEVMRLSPRSSEDFAAARRRVEALTLPDARDQAAIWHN